MVAALANRSQESLPSNSEKNLKEQANVITLRNERQLEPEQSRSTDPESLKGAMDSNERIAESNRRRIHYLNG